MRSKQYFTSIKNNPHEISTDPILCVQNIMAQKRTVSGIVTDSKNEPLIGVNVTIKNASTTGTITDIDGKYSLEIPSGNSVLVFSYIGYSTQEVKVSNRSVVDIVLKDDMQALEEVVVVGYGTMKYP